MAVPTAAECKLNLSFDMVAKTMTVGVSDEIAEQGALGLTYNIYYIPKTMNFPIKSKVI